MLRAARIFAPILTALALAQSGTGRFGPAPLVEAGPGDYATLFFILEGEGAGGLELKLPEGWKTLAFPEELILNSPRTPVVITVRVPETARAGKAYPVTLRFCPEAGACQESRGRVTVLHRPGILLHVEPQVEGITGEPVAIRVTVTNQGNLPDRVRLTVQAHSGIATIEPQVLKLEPGATGYATLKVGLRPDQVVSPGYQMAAWVHATSQYGVKTQTRTLIRWLPPGGFYTEGEDPTIRYRVRGSLGLGVYLKEGRFDSWSFSYGLAPSLKGRLSDFVAVEARTNPIKKSEETIWPEPPRSLLMNFAGEDWTTAFAIERERVAFSLGFKPGNWRYEIGGNGRYDLREFNLSAGLASARRDLNLQLAGQVRLKNESRSERLHFRHVRPLGQGWALRLGAQYTGQQDENEYFGVLTANPELVWRDRDYNFISQMTLAPQIGLYAVSVSGGMRHFYPIGLRGSASYQTDPGGDRYRVFASAVAVPQPGSVFKLDAGIFREAGQLPQFQLVPALNLLTRIGRGGNQLSLGGSYRLTYRPASGEASHGLQGRIRLSGPRCSLSAHIGYVFGEPHPIGELRFSLQPTMEDNLEFGYIRESKRIRYLASWDRRWGGGVQSFLGFLRTEEPTPTDRIRVGVIVRRIGGSPLGLSLGYSLVDPDGFGEGSAGMEHRFRLGLVFGLEGRFTTPEEVMQAFGGRREGEVIGRAFVDENQNGRWDEGEPGVSRVTVVLGRDQSTTDERGHYRIRVRPGVYRPRLRDLPAELDLYQDLLVRVRQGKRVRFDLPLAPTAQVAVWVFFDENRNGRPDPGEHGIPYAGVRIEGPGGVKTVRTDAEGRALVGGLLPGQTRFAPDPKALPPRYRATAEPRTLDLRPGRWKGELALGAAPPPKKVATTFRPGKLAVFGHLPKPTAVPGGELEVRALVTGKAQEVWVELPNGERVVLHSKGGNRYQGRLRLPRDQTPGPLSLKVIARRGNEWVEAPIFATVVQGRPYRLEPSRARVGTFPVRVELQFRAESLRLELGNGDVIELQSKDGYRWTGWITANVLGPLRVQPVADGEALDPTSIELVSGKEDGK